MKTRVMRTVTEKDAWGDTRIVGGYTETYRAKCAWCKGEVKKDNSGRWVHVVTGDPMPCKADENSQTSQ